MSTTIPTIEISAEPSGEFIEVSRYNDTEESILALIRAGKPFKFDVYNLPVLTTNVERALQAASYADCIVDDVHFLRPKLPR